MKMHVVQQNRYTACHSHTMECYIATSTRSYWYRQPQDESQKHRKALEARHRKMYDSIHMKCNNRLNYDDTNQKVGSRVEVGEEEEN